MGTVEFGIAPEGAVYLNDVAGVINVSKSICDLGD
jgi:hypothetical protein